MVPITWDKIGMKNLTKRSFFSTSTKTVPINPENTRKLLQSFQIDLDDSGLLCLVAQLHNTRAGLISVLHQLGRHSVFCKPREYPKVAAVFPNWLGWLWTVVSGCATPQYPSWIDLCPSSTLTTLSILFFANPENTRELLQFFQIDLDDSPLVVFGGATSVNSNWKEVFKN